jgi:hypothetical protein
MRNIIALSLPFRCFLICRKKLCILSVYSYMGDLYLYMWMNVRIIKSMHYYVSIVK